MKRLQCCWLRWRRSPPPAASRARPTSCCCRTRSAPCARCSRAPTPRVGRQARLRADVDGVARTTRCACWRSGSGRFRRTIGGELFEMGKQLITIQELAGMSSKRIMELRSTMEERAPGRSEPAAEHAAAPRWSTGSGAALPDRRSTSCARQLRSRAGGLRGAAAPYPDFEEASAALLYIGQSYAEESAGPRKPIRCTRSWSDVTRSPRTPRRRCTSTGCRSLPRGGRRPRARHFSAWYASIRQSTEAELAGDRLQTIR